MVLRQHSNEVMVEVLTVARQEIPADGEARLTARAARGGRRRRAICSVRHGLVEETNCVQVSCSCDAHRRCALGFCEAIPRAGTFGEVHLVMCPNPALHQEHQEVDLHPLLQQIRALCRSVNTTEEHEIRARVTAAEQRLRRRAYITPEVVDLSRNLTERDEEDHHGEWRGTIPQQQVRAPCGVCGRHLEDNQRFTFGGWLVHRTCAVESAAGADGRGDDRFGVAIRDGSGVSRRRTFRLTAIVPRIHMRYDRTTPDGAHQQRQLEILQRSLTSGVEEAASQGEGGQDVERGLEESEEFWCTYCGWPLDNSSGESGEDHARVPVPCTRCMLARAENLARGHADPRPCVACRSAWPGGSRPPDPAELA